MHKNLMGLMGAMGLLVGCSSNGTIDPLPLTDPSKSPPGAASDALELEQIRQDYEACLERLGDKDTTCQNIRWMFEDAWSRYEAAQRAKPQPKPKP